MYSDDENENTNRRKQEHQPPSNENRYYAPPQGGGTMSNEHGLNYLELLKKQVFLHLCCHLCDVTTIFKISNSKKVVFHFVKNTTPGGVRTEDHQHRSPAP